MFTFSETLCTLYTYYHLRVRIDNVCVCVCVCVRVCVHSGEDSEGTGDPGGPGNPDSPLTLGFEPPKLRIFGSYLFFHFFCLTSLGILFL